MSPWGSNNRYIGPFLGKPPFTGTGPVPVGLDLIPLVRATAKALHPSVSYSGGTNGMCRQQDGTWIANPNPGQPRWGWSADGQEQIVHIEQAATNLITNSSLGGSVVVTAQTYTISFYGTGSLYLSGTYVTTIASVYPNRASVTFTPTAGTLTITPTGSVLYIQLETGSVATSPIPTNGSPVTRAADDFAVDNTVLGLRGAEATVISRSKVDNANTNPAVLGTDAGWTPQYTMTSGMAFGAGSDMASATNTSGWPMTAVTSYGAAGCSAIVTGSVETIGTYTVRPDGFGLRLLVGLLGELAFLAVLKRQAPAAERAALVNLRIV